MDETSQPMEYTLIQKIEGIPAQAWITYQDLTTFDMVSRRITVPANKMLTTTYEDHTIVLEEDYSRLRQKYELRVLKDSQEVFAKRGGFLVHRDVRRVFKHVERKVEAYEMSKKKKVSMEQLLGSHA